MYWLFLTYIPEETVYGYIVPEGSGVVDFALQIVGVRVGQPERISIRKI